MQIGIRLHDVNSKGSAEEKSLAGRVKTAAAEGFGCIHLALDKVLLRRCFHRLQYYCFGGKLWISAILPARTM